MTLMNAILGAAGQMSESDQEAFAEKMLLPGEHIVAAFKTKRDSYVFTEYRVLFEDVQGLTGKKRSVMSVPYDKISAYSVETAGHFDTDGELRLFVSGFPGGQKEGVGVIKKEVRDKVDVYLLHQILSEQVIDHSRHTK